MKPDPKLLTQLASQKFDLPFTLLETPDGDFAAIPLSTLTELLLSRMLEQPQPAEAPPEQVVTDRQATKTILDYLGHRGAASMLDLRAQFPEVSRQLPALLDLLIDKGVVVKEGHTNATRYKLAEKSPTASSKPRLSSPKLRQQILRVLQRQGSAPLLLRNIEQRIPGTDYRTLFQEIRQMPEVLISGARRGTRYSLKPAD